VKPWRPGQGSDGRDLYSMRRWSWAFLLEAGQARGADCHDGQQDYPDGTVRIR